MASTTRPEPPATTIPAITRRWASARFEVRGVPPILAIAIAIALPGCGENPQDLAGSVELRSRTARPTSSNVPAKVRAKALVKAVRDKS